MPDELLVMTQQSDLRAQFEGHVRQYSAELVQYAYARGNTLEDAGDIVQRAFLKAWQSWRSGARPQMVRAWLYRIVHNEASNFRREARVRERALPAREPDRAADEGTIGEETASLLRALRKLPETFGEALVLHYLQGLSIGDVAELLGVPAGTAKSKIARGLALLRERTAGGGST